MNPGDRVLLKYWGGHVPRWLVGTLGTVVDVNRVRVTVRFDEERFTSKTRPIPADWLIPVEETP